MTSSAVTIALSAGAFAALLIIALKLAILDDQSEHYESTAAAPLWWRIAAPCLQPLARWPGPLIARCDRTAMRVALEAAGLDDTLSAEQIAACRLALAAILLIVLLAVVNAALAAAPLPMALAAVAAATGALVLPRLILRNVGKQRLRRIVRELPFQLDLLTLCIEAGMSWTAAIRQLVDKGPPGTLSGEWRRVLHDINAGRPRADALRGLAHRAACPAIASLVAALISAERSGASIGAVLRSQATQRRTERFHRAEALALQAPTRMLLPLVLCIFPCTFLILMFPLALRLLAAGVH